MSKINTTETTVNKLMVDVSLNQNSVKTPFFLKKLRSRSKTYSGEEIEAQLNKNLKNKKYADNNKLELHLKALVTKQEKK